MMEAELIVGVIIIISFSIITFLTCIVVKMHYKKEKHIRNVYLCKLANTDSSIQNAMEFLKLTNGIEQKLNGEIN